jgi:pimeloyl-ACP methyl ester carboxylesterase
MERFVEVPGCRLLVMDDGDGPPILLLHAGIADHRAWDAMVGPLTAAGYRAIRYDLRSFGRSTTEDVEFSNRADAVAILDTLGIERVALVGNSRGGVIALDTAIEYPDRVVALISVAGGIGGFETSSTPEEEALFEEMERLESADPPDPDAVADFDVRFWVDGPGQPADRVPAAIRDAVREMDKPQWAPGHVDGRPITLEPRAAERLADLHCPVLAIAGGLDASESAQVARHLEANAPNARAMILPDVAHMIGMEIPDDLSRLIVEFLEPLGSWH